MLNSLRILLSLALVAFVAANANAAVWPAFSCDDEGCLICEDCDDDGVCVCSEYVTYGEMIAVFSVPDFGLASPRSKASDKATTKGTTDYKANVRLHKLMIDALGGREPEAKEVVFWSCGNNDLDLCCAGGEGCRLMIERCNLPGASTEGGTYDENAGVGTCNREDE